MMICGISPQGYLFTDTDMDGIAIDLVAKVYDDSITLESLPERFFLAFTYYVLHRYYAPVDAQRSNYYLAMHEREWLKVHRPQLRQYTIDLGSDL